MVKGNRAMTGRRERAVGNMDRQDGEELAVIEEELMEIKDALVLVGFPTIGIVSSIVSNHVIRQLSLKRIGFIDSRYFVPTAVIIDGVPNPPVRIYGGEHKCGPDRRCQQVIVVTSEFTPPAHLMEPIADLLLDWTASRRASLIVTVEGVNSSAKEGGDAVVLGVGSTLEARHMLKDLGVELMADGMVGGLSGVLLHRGLVAKRNVISLLAETPSAYPGARSAAKTIEVLDRMLPLIKLDPKPLYEKAAEIEKAIKEAMNRATPRAELGPENNPAYS